MTTKRLVYANHFIGVENPEDRCGTNTERNTIPAVEDMDDLLRTSAGEKRRNMERAGRVSLQSVDRRFGGATIGSGLLLTYILE